MKYILFLLIPLCSMQTTNAQDAKIKKGVVYVEDQAFLSFEDKLYSGYPVIMKTNSGLEAMTFLIIRDESYNDHFGKMMPDNTFVIKFIDFEAEMNTKLQPKKIFGKMYSAGVINDDGTVNQEEAERFTNIYDQDIPIKIKIGY